MGNKYDYLKIPDKKELNFLYSEKLMTQVEIGILYNTTQKVVFTWFKKLGIESRVACKRNQMRENNSSWKGNKVTYAAYHYRVQSSRGKANRCEMCNNKNAKRYEWANLTGNYNDVNDYKMMCVSCHHKRDNHKNNLPNRKEPKNINKRKIIDGK